MYLFSVLNGDVLHFNKNAVPALNNISDMLLSANTEYGARDELQKMLAASSKMVDHLFNPNDGIIKNKVKSYDIDAFYQIYLSFILLIVSLNPDKNIAGIYLDQLKKVLGNYQKYTLVYENFFATANLDEKYNILWKIISSHANGLTQKDEEDYKSKLRISVLHYAVN